MQGCTLVDLPDDLLEQIVVRVDTFDRARLSCACKASKVSPSKADVAWAIMLRDFEDISDLFSIVSVRLDYMGVTFTIFRNGETIGAEARDGTRLKCSSGGRTGAHALFQETFKPLHSVGAGDCMAQLVHTVYVWGYTEYPSVPRRSYPRWFYPVKELYIPFQSPVL